MSIGAYVDDTPGGNSDVNAVNSYIKTVLDGWTRNYNNDVYQQVSDVYDVEGETRETEKKRDRGREGGGERDRKKEEEK